jgi:TonB family protein
MKIAEREQLGSAARLALAFIAAAMGAGIVAAQTAPDANRYVGRVYILRDRGSEKEIRARAGTLSKPAEMCDAAVAVAAASFESGDLKITLEPVGIVHYAKSSSVCRTIPAKISVAIADVRASSQDEVDRVVGVFLLTPEAYIASFGDKFDFPGGDHPDLPVVPLSTPNIEAPKSVLTVDASYTDAARRAHVSGTVVAEVTIGRDGRAASGNLIKSLGYGLDEQVLRVLTLGRFTPARLDDKPVAVRVSLEMSFSVL